MGGEEREGEISLMFSSLFFYLMGWGERSSIWIRGEAGGRRGRGEAHSLGGEENDGWKMVWVSIISSRASCILALVWLYWDNGKSNGNY